jgi:ribosomal protein S12 methylthiotransferase
MNRPGDSNQLIKLIEKMRMAIPGITLRTTFITGFPGESEKDFQELLDFMSEVKFDRVGVFPYSQEDQTPAAEMPDQIPEGVRNERRDRAMALQQEISLELNRQKIGKTLTVLVEDGISGRSEGDAPEIDGKVFISADRPLYPGEFVQVLITDAVEYDLAGTLVT